MAHTPHGIDAVPVEIWDRIFCQAVPPLNQNLADQINPQFVSRPDTRLSITHTCARWRHIAVSRPLLWNTFNVYFHGGDNQTPNRHLVDLMIERSANVPLSINLFMIDVDETTVADPTSAVYSSLKALSTTTTRWKYFGLYSRGCSLPLPLSEQLSTIGAPLLESLRLDARLENRESDALFSGLREKSPPLHKVLLSLSNNNSHHLEHVSSTIPYDNITSLYIHSHMTQIAEGISVVAYVLHNSPNLVSCVISNIDVDYPSMEMEMPSVPKSKPLPRLEYLHLGEGPSDLPVTTILDYITAPSLRTLALTNMGRWYSGHDQLERFIVQSGCSLDEFHLFNLHYRRPDALNRILRCFPSINGLHVGRLQCMLDDPTFVNDMTGWNSRMNEFEICPNLSWLSFHDPTAFDIVPENELTPSGMDSLVRILKARLDPPDSGKRRFERVHIPSDYLSMELYDDIRALSDDPYALDVRSEDGDMYDIYKFWERYGDR